MEDLEMRSFFLFLSCVCVIIFVPASLSAKGWRTIVPLRTTRSEVEAVLGKPEDPNKMHSLVYRTDKEIVVIDYEDDQPCGHTDGWRVPSGTVTSITVSPKLELRLSDIEFDESKYKKVHSPDMPPERFIYVNDEEGESLDVFQERVVSLTYFPEAKDAHLRCTRRHSSAELKGFEYNYHPIDTYYYVPFKYEKQRLDNLAIHLQQKPETTGYIIVYPGRRTRFRLAKAYAARARNYILEVRLIDSQRVITIVGGRRERLTFELYLLPSSAPAPMVLFYERGCQEQTSRLLAAFLLFFNRQPMMHRQLRGVAAASCAVSASCASDRDVWAELWQRRV
jgi:hypothetical protein